MVAVSVAVIAATLIVSGLVSSWGGSGSSSPSTTAVPSTSPAPAPTGSPTQGSTAEPYDQLLGQLEAVLGADGQDRAFAMLVDAVASSPQAAGMCLRLAADLARVAPATDWRAACG